MCSILRSREIRGLLAFLEAVLVTAMTPPIGKTVDSGEGKIIPPRDAARQAALSVGPFPPLPTLFHPLLNGSIQLFDGHVLGEQRRGASIEHGLLIFPTSVHREADDGDVGVAGLYFSR